MSRAHGAGAPPIHSGTGHSGIGDSHVRDSRRSAVYAAERMVHRMFDQVGATRVVEIAGTQLTLPAEAQFASLDSVRDHVAAVTSMASVRTEFPRAQVPLAVRARRGQSSAHYTRYPDEHGENAEIAIPVAGERWALRELVVLHEVAHHLDGSSGAAHGPEFVRTLTDLVGLVLGPEVAFVYRVVFADSGLG